MSRKPDIVERLRDPPVMSVWLGLMAEAAAEIERLRTALQAIERETGFTMLVTNHGRRGDKAYEIARAALEHKP